MRRTQPSPYILASANPVDAAGLTLEERLTELAAILAPGAVRLRGRQSSRLCSPPENCLVDFTATQSGGVCVNTMETPA